MSTSAATRKERDGPTATRRREGRETEAGASAGGDAPSITRAQRIVRELDGLQPSCILTTEELEYLQSHRVFTPDQLAEFAQQLKEFKQMNRLLKVARAQLLVYEASVRNWKKEKSLRQKLNRIGSRAKHYEDVAAEVREDKRRRLGLSETPKTQSEPDPSEQTA